MRDEGGMADMAQEARVLVLIATTEPVRFPCLPTRGHTRQHIFHITALLYCLCTTTLELRTQWWTPEAHVSTTESTYAKPFFLLHNSTHIVSTFCTIIHNEAWFVHMDNTGLQIANSNYQLVSITPHHSGHERNLWLLHPLSSLSTSWEVWEGIIFFFFFCKTHNCSEENEKTQKYSSMFHSWQDTTVNVHCVVHNNNNTQIDNPYTYWAVLYCIKTQ